MRGSVLVFVLCVSCGPGIQTRKDTGRTSDVFVQAVVERDVTAIASHFGTPLVYGGMYFANPDCLQKFPAPAVIAPAKHAEFADCLTTLTLAASQRKDELYNVVVYNYAPGIEIEAKFDDLGDGPKLTWIGYSGRRGLFDGLPTITPSLLESVRTGGDPRGTPSPEDAAKLAAEPSNIPNDKAWAWLKVCLDADGAITNVHPREASTPLASKVFSDLARTWTFKPVSLGGSSSVPACALVRLSHPPLESPEVLPVAFEIPEQAIRIPKTRLQQTAGIKAIVPEDRDKTRLMQRNIERILGAFGFCFDESGSVYDVRAIEPTGLPEYDAKIAYTIKKTWKFKPYIYEGKPAKACTAITFIYSQR